MQTKRKIAIIVIASIVFTCILTVRYNTKDIVDSGTIGRPDYQSDTQKLQLDVYTQKNEEPMEIEIDVEPRQYTQEEAMQAFEEISDKLPEIIVADNKDINNVNSRLNLVEYVDGYMVQLEWFSSDYSLINYNGDVNINGLEADEKKDVTLTAKLTSSDYEAESTIDVVVCNSGLSEYQKRKKDITAMLASAEQSQKNSDSVVLPESIDGEKATYVYRSRKTSPFMAIALGMVAIVAVLTGGREQRLKAAAIRNRQLKYEYSELVSKLTLLIGAGMTISGAWERISGDYLEGMSKGRREQNVAYDEMVISQLQTDNGIPEAAVYEQFARRCNTREYIKLGMLLEQNVRKGTKDLLQLLEQETFTAFEEHKEMARKKGEEAGTKLLIPMIIMLVVVMIIVMVPAVMSFDF